VSILTFLGYFFGQNEALLNEHLHTITIAVIAFIVLPVSFIFGYTRKKNASESQKSSKG